MARCFLTIEFTVDVHPLRVKSAGGTSFGSVTAFVFPEFWVTFGLRVGLLGQSYPRRNPPDKSVPNRGGLLQALFYDWANL